MTSSNVAVFVVAVLLLGTVVNSQSVYQQTYGQGVYSQYPRGPVLVVPPNPQSDISIWIIPIVLVVLVVILIPSLVGSSWIIVDKMKTLPPPTQSTSIPTTLTTTMTTPSTSTTTMTTPSTSIPTTSTTTMITPTTYEGEGPMG